MSNTKATLLKMDSRQLPLASIVTCTYNKFDNIFDTIYSIIEQDYPFLELVIADDGSLDFKKQKDAVLEYINKNKGDNIKNVTVYSNNENVGTVKNLNLAYKKAQGSYIINLSCDDCFYDKTVVSRIIERMKSSKCEVLSTSRLAVNRDGEAQYYMPHSIDRKKLNGLTREQQYRMLVSGQFYAMFSGSALAFKKTVFERVGYYDEKYRLWEDGPFLERYLRNDRVEAAYDIVSVRYMLGGNSTGEVHPQLKKDTELYTATDRIARVDELNHFYKRLTLYNSRVDRDNKKCGIDVLMYKAFYKGHYLMGESIDKMKLNNSKRKG